MVIPQREAWLYENKKALAQVRRGLADAKAGELAKLPPAPALDAKYPDSIPDEE